MASAIYSSSHPPNFDTRLSFGWYESIFASYLARKVSVIWCCIQVSDNILARQSGYLDGSVNSLQSLNHADGVSGGQSVGKSYSLNHFVDTSFAGSPTEGAWLSVTPTQDALVVSIDFESNAGPTYKKIDICSEISLQV